MSGDPYVQEALAGRPVPGFVVDVHGHLGENPEFAILNYRDLDLFVREMDRHGVDVCCVTDIPATLGGLQSGGNATVLEAVRRFPDRFFGWAAANPHYPDTMLAELERCREGGCWGLKVHNACGLPYSHDNYLPLFEFAARHGMPVLAHTWGSDLPTLEPHFGRFPGINWTLGHAGSVEPESYVRVALEHPNVYLDTCFSSSPRGLLEYFVRSGVGDKLLFSSDCYFMSLSQQLGRVLFAEITPEQKAAILGENARRFLGAACPG
jgi:hypothetical protein